MILYLKRFFLTIAQWEQRVNNRRVFAQNLPLLNAHQYWCGHCGENNVKVMFCYFGMLIIFLSCHELLMVGYCGQFQWKFFGSEWVRIYVANRLETTITISAGLAENIIVPCASSVCPNYHHFIFDGSTQGISELVWAGGVYIKDL